MISKNTQDPIGHTVARWTSFALLAGTLLYGAQAEEGSAPPTKRTNAALDANGARVHFTAPKEVSRNKETAPEATFDGDVHSRCVITGVPYTFEVELVEALPIDAIGFADSDYESEEAPKDVTIELDDGTKIEHALELQRPLKRKPAWQEVAVGKTSRVIKITVNTNHAGKVAWGGFGEIAVFTKEDLSKLLALPDHDAKAPSFVDVAPLDAANGEIKVNMPPKAEKGEHPCLLLTPKELADVRETVQKEERGKEAYALLQSKAEDALKLEIDFPDPKGPGAQLKDRGDELAKRHDKLSYTAGNLGMAYAFLGKEEYAKKAREILIGYAERYEQYPEHQGANRSDTSKVMAQRLSEAMWLVPLLIGYDYIHDSAVLSAEDRARVESGLIRPCLAMIHRKDPKSIAAEWDKSRAGWRTDGPPKPKTTHVVGNWTNFYNLATIMAGATMGDADLVDLAVYQTKENLLAGIGEDGMWGEGTIGYQMFALQALTAVMEVAARQGVDLWGFDHARIKMPFDANFRFAYPDGSAPGINDSGRVTFSDWSGMVYDYAYLRYGDARYARLVNACPRQLVISTGVFYPTRVYTKLPELAEIKYPSTVFKDLGYAILRSSGTYALMDYGPHGGPHGHPDKLNVVLFAGGDELGGEPHMHRYEDPLHGNWTKATVAHNTMAVDERSQSACTGKLLVYADSGAIKVMRAEATEAYPGVVLDRTIVMTPGVLIDLYHGSSAREHRWDRTFRYQGTMDGWEAPATDAPALGSRNGYNLLKVVSNTPADNDTVFSWKRKDTAWQVALAGTPGQEAVKALGPDGDQMLLARQRGKTADFGAALRVEGWGGALSHATIVRTEEQGLLAYKVDQDGVETLVVVAYRPGDWSVRGWTSDARVLVAQSKDGVVQRVFVGGGTHAACGDQKVATVTAQNSYAERVDGVLKVAVVAAKP